MRLKSLQFNLQHHCANAKEKTRLSFPMCTDRNYFSNTSKTSENQTNLKSCNTLCILCTKHDFVHRIDGKGAEYIESSSKCVPTYVLVFEEKRLNKRTYKADIPDKWHPQRSFTIASRNRTPPAWAKRSLSIQRAISPWRTVSQEKRRNLYFLSQLILYWTKGPEKTF